MVEDRVIHRRYCYSHKGLRISQSALQQARLLLSKTFFLCQIITMSCFVTINTYLGLVSCGAKNCGSRNFLDFIKRSLSNLYNTWNVSTFSTTGQEKNYSRKNSISLWISRVSIHQYSFKNSCPCIKMNNTGSLSIDWFILNPR